MGEAKEAPIGAIGAIPICESCGSEEVVRDAWAIWDPQTGDWTLADVFDHAFCRACESATTLGWRWLPQKERIRIHNDALRQRGAGNGTIHVTSGIMAHGEPFVRAVVAELRRFNAFDRDNDPHGEHDFGALEVAGERIFFKIDYYDLAQTMHSPDPADPSVTWRVLTIMLASEY